jgi:hypothetical protein
MDEPTQLPLDEFLDALHAFFLSHGQAPHDSRIRDSVIEALHPHVVAVTPPVPGIVTEAEAVRVARYYEGDHHATEFFDEAHHEVLQALEAFRLYQRRQGQDAYIIWSEAFYDDPQHEEEKVYRCPIDYPFPKFVENYSMTGLLAAADTVLLRPDFRQMMIRFHHDWYEFYDASFAEDFLRYCREQDVS